MRRLLDLYLTGDFTKEMLIDRKNRLETTISALEEEKASLIAQLESRTLTDSQMRALEEFAACIVQGLGRADEDFEIRRQIIDILDVQATLTVENGEKVAYVRCVVGDGVLRVANDTFRDN